MNIFKPVKNFSKGRTQQVKGICVHITDSGAWQAYRTFDNPNEKKSSHYLILRTGEIWQMVKEEDIAWAQGLKVNPTAQLILENINLNPNEILISIEHEAFSGQDLTEIQYVNSAKLISEICERYGLERNTETIIKHNSVRSDKYCPGLVNISKLINLTYNPPQVSEIESLKIKISLMTKILELLKSISFYKKLGSIEDERGL